jgi:hypothetical protein
VENKKEEVQAALDQRVYEFLKNLLDPDMYGHAVTAEVRDEARGLIGLKKVETV